MNAGWIRYRFTGEEAEADAAFMPAAPAAAHEGRVETARSK
ncbi:MAG TPA: hypothetical protein VMT29_10935 [Steroidobacteraceae bacterium]|jgi:hypothetical protein|nr:hypothetical protein [Steroidobacteraceae bacterium]